MRGYASLDVAFRSGPHLIVGPNAAGKTSLLEAMVLLAWGRSHRTSSESELVRWGADLARVEGRVVPSLTLESPADATILEVALVHEGAGVRKRIRVNGVARRASALADALRVVIFAPEEMLLVAGSPGLRRAALDTIVTAHHPAHAIELAAYSRTLQQRNGLLRALREETAGRDELQFWDHALLNAGSVIVERRLETLAAISGPLRRAHDEIAPDEGHLTLSYETNAPARPGESVRGALERRLAETADKEIWNGTTLIGPHRDDFAFELEGRDLSGFGSRGQQRTAILALKLAELDLSTEAAGSPPLLLLDDVFSELDPERRAHLVRRIAELPQAFVTTTTLDDIDPALRAVATSWQVATSPDGATVGGPRTMVAG